jgi:hypothetical protein
MDLENYFILLMVFSQLTDPKSHLNISCSWGILEHFYVTIDIA